MNVYIFGDGNNAKLIALILGITDLYIDTSYTSITQNTILSDVICIPLSELLADELIKFKSVFDYTDYVIHRKIGFKYKNQVYKTATSSMIYDYLSKQNRKHVDDFHFELEHDAIDVTRCINDISSMFTCHDEQELENENDCIFIYTNKQYDTYAKSNYVKEYIVQNCNDMLGYSYIYDCDYNSNVKRYSSSMTEYLTNADNAIEILNYVDKPTIRIKYDIKRNRISIYIGRYATKSRMLLSDSIKFALKLKENIENERI